MEQCSGAEQIPLVRLFGQSPSGFSTGDTDLRNYYDTIDLRRSNELETAISNIYKLVLSSLGIKIPDDFDIEFGSLWQMNETERSELANQNLETVARAEEAMLIDKPTALKELKQMSKKTGVFTNITVDMINQAELEPPPTPEGMEQGEDKPPTFGSQLANSDLENLSKQNAGDNNDKLDMDKNNSSSGDNPVNNSKPTGNKRLPEPQKENAKRTGDELSNETQTTSGICVVSGSSSVLLLQRADNGLWAFPAGHIENGESSSEAARREFFEETGIDVADKISDDWTKDCKRFRLGNFVSFLITGADAPGWGVKLNKENTDSSWVSWGRLSNQKEKIMPECYTLLEQIYESLYPGYRL